jgi:hypothetical protein
MPLKPWGEEQVLLWNIDRAVTDQRGRRMQGERSPCYRVIDLRNVDDFTRKSFLEDALGRKHCVTKTLAENTIYIIIMYSIRSRQHQVKFPLMAIHPLNELAALHRLDLGIKPVQGSFDDTPTKSTFALYHQHLRH